jgi:hypothetical protein
VKVPITVSSSHEPAVTYYFRLKPQADSVLLENAARSNRRDEEEWSSLWQVKVPSKLRFFLWRLARHSLASADVFHHRNMADHLAGVLYVELLIPGYTLCLSATGQDVCGHWNAKKLLNTNVSCSRKIPGRGWLI